jgi:hypothetical protein
MILVRGPTWSSRVEPTGLTGLAIFPEDKKPDANPNADIKAVLRANHDRSMINEDIDHYTNNKLFIPTTFDEIKIQIECQICILATFFGHNAYITRANETFVGFLNSNSETFSDLLRSDPLIGAKFVYSIDLANQTYLHALGESSEKPLREIPSSGLKWAFHAL